MYDQHMHIQYDRQEQREIVHGLIGENSTKNSEQQTASTHAAWNLKISRVKQIYASFTVVVVAVAVQLLDIPYNCLLLDCKVCIRLAYARGNGIFAVCMCFFSSLNWLHDKKSIMGSRHYKLLHVHFMYYHIFIE